MPQTVVPGLRSDIRYAGAHNFTGAPVTGHEAPRCWLTRQAADALGSVQADLAPLGLGLLVYDCYRPLRAVGRFLDWAKAPGEETGKREFYPDIAKAELFAQGYIAARSAHSAAARPSTSRWSSARAGGRSTWARRSTSSGPHPIQTRTGCRARPAPIAPCWRRRWRRRGFAGYDREWWHFTLRDEPYPVTGSTCP